MYQREQLEKAVHDTFTQTNRKSCEEFHRNIAGFDLS